MPIGKDSITKRVAKTAPTAEVQQENIAPELVATTAAAPKKAPAKKACESKKATAKKPAAKKASAKVSTNVLTSVAPETVEAVIGRKESDSSDKVSIGEALPMHLL